MAGYSNFTKKLSRAVLRNDSLVCIGLDPARDKMPLGISDLFDFNKAIIDSTKDLVCAYKPNSAFYEAGGDKGIRALKLTCDYIKQTTENIPIILDYKRADIGNTNLGYMIFAFDYLEADAVTLHPYMGGESLKPFLERSEKGIFILCRTSNPGAGELQDLEINGKKLYQIVAEKVRDEWNSSGNCGLVVGATYPAELSDMRNRMGQNIIFLVPGVGAQGADIKQTVLSGQNSAGTGIIVNSSRGIIYASSSGDFAVRAREETSKLRDEINIHRKGK